MLSVLRPELRECHYPMCPQAVWEYKSGGWTVGTVSGLNRDEDPMISRDPVSLNPLVSLAR